MHKSLQKGGSSVDLAFFNVSFGQISLHLQVRHWAYARYWSARVCHVTVYHFLDQGLIIASP